MAPTRLTSRKTVTFFCFSSSQRIFLDFLGPSLFPASTTHLFVSVTFSPNSHLPASLDSDTWILIANRDNLANLFISQKLSDSCQVPSDLMSSLYVMLKTRVWKTVRVICLLRSRNETGPRLCLNLNTDKHVTQTSTKTHFYTLWIHVSANVHHNGHKNIHLVRNCHLLEHTFTQA